VIEPGEVEILSGIADDDGAMRPAPLTLKLLNQIGMNEQRGRAVIRGEPIARGLSRREQFAFPNVQTELSKAPQHFALRHAGGVGDETHRKTRLAQALDCRKSAGQRMIAVVDHAGEVEQGATDHGFKFERMTSAGQRRPSLCGGAPLGQWNRSIAMPRSALQNGSRSLRPQMLYRLWPCAPASAPLCITWKTRIDRLTIVRLLSWLGLCGGSAVCACSRGEAQPCMIFVPI
jgi:hypothetical protein